MTNRSKRPSRDGTCRSCGGPTGSRALCSTCSPHKRHRAHRDKYAHRTPKENR